MNKNRRVQGSQPEETYAADLEDALMLDEPGTIVEPDVRKALLKYFKDMKMLEGAYLSKSNRTYSHSEMQRCVSMRINKTKLRRIIRETVQNGISVRSQYRAVREAAMSSVKPTVDKYSDGSFEVSVPDGRFVLGYHIDPILVDEGPTKFYMAKNFDNDEDAALFSTSQKAIDWASSRLTSN